MIKQKLYMCNEFTFRPLRKVVSEKTATKICYGQIDKNTKVKPYIFLLRQSVDKKALYLNGRKLVPIGLPNQCTAISNVFVITWYTLYFGYFIFNAHLVH
jgi:hypothetical protein